MNWILAGTIWTIFSFWFMSILGGRSGKFVAWRLAGRGNGGTTSIFLLVIALPAYAIHTIYNFARSLVGLGENIKNDVSNNQPISIYSILSIITIIFMSYIGYEIISWIEHFNNFIDTGKLSSFN